MKSKEMKKLELDFAYAFMNNNLALAQPDDDSVERLARYCFQ